MWQRWLICLSMFSWFIISMNHLACKISEDSKKSQLYFLRHKFMYSDRLLRFHPINNPDPEYNQLPIVWLRKVKSVWLIVWSRDRNNESGSKIVAHFHRSNLLNRCSSSWSPLKCLQFGSVRTQISRHPPKAVVIPSSRDIGGFFHTVAILWLFTMKSNSLRVFQVSSPAIETWCRASLSVSTQGRVTSASAPPTTALFASGIQTTRFS